MSTTLFKGPWHSPINLSSSFKLRVEGSKWLITPKTGPGMHILTLKFQFYSAASKLLPSAGTAVLACTVRHEKMKSRRYVVCFQIRPKILQQTAEMHAEKKSVAVMMFSSFCNHFLFLLSTKARPSKAQFLLAEWDVFRGCRFILSPLIVARLLYGSTATFNKRGQIQIFLPRQV